MENAHLPIPVANLSIYWYGMDYITIDKITLPSHVDGILHLYFPAKG